MASNPHNREPKVNIGSSHQVFDLCFDFKGDFADITPNAQGHVVKRRIGGCEGRGLSAGSLGITGPTWSHLASL